MLGYRPHSPTRAYEDQASTIDAGYQPKNVEEGNRASSQPPPNVNRAYLDQDEGLINTPSLGIHVDGQTGHAGILGLHVKRQLLHFHRAARPSSRRLPHLHILLCLLLLLSLLEPTPASRVLLIRSHHLR